MPFPEYGSGPSSPTTCDLIPQVWPGSSREGSHQARTAVLDYWAGRAAGREACGEAPDVAIQTGWEDLGSGTPPWEPPLADRAAEEGGGCPVGWASSPLLCPPPKQAAGTLNILQSVLFLKKKTKNLFVEKRNSLQPHGNTALTVLYSTQECGPQLAVLDSGADSRMQLFHARSYSGLCCKCSTGLWNADWVTKPRKYSKVHKGKRWLRPDCP